MTHKLDADDMFIHRVQRYAADQDLNFFLVEPLWAGAFFEKLRAGELSVRVLLNMHSEHHQPDELYHRLVLWAAENGVEVIDPPGVALAAFNKATIHPRLVEAGLPVPRTVIVSHAELAGFPFDGLQARIGIPFVVKPAMGYGRRGVVLEAATEADVQRSAAEWPDSHYLLQERVIPGRLGDDPAYFRVYFVFGSIWCVWWNCFTDQYRILTPAEEESFGLTPLRDLVRRVAELTGMRFFSSEIARTEAGAFVLIDYVNDQCHMLSQSANSRIGVPDELVTAIAGRLVEGARELIQRRRAGGRNTV